MDDTTIRISKDLRECLGKMRIAKRESYEEIIRRKLFSKKQQKKSIKQRLENADYKEGRIKDMIGSLP